MTQQKKSAPGVEPAPMPAPGAEPTTKPAEGATKNVTGTIRSVSGSEVTLADGMKLTIPATVRVQREALLPGAAVMASYEVKDGKNVVHEIQVAR